MRYMIFAIMASLLSFTGCTLPPPSPISSVDGSIKGGVRVHTESSLLDALTAEYLVTFKNLPTGITIRCDQSTEGQRMTNGKGEVKLHIPKKFAAFTLTFTLDGKLRSFTFNNYRYINDYRWENGAFVDEYLEFYKNNR